MEFRKLMFAGLALSMMVACSQNEELANGTNGTGTEGDAYMALSIEMPNTGNTTRAIDESGEKHEGTTGEQQITNLLLLVYDVNDGSQLQYSHLYNSTDLRPQAPTPSNDKSTVYTITPFQIESGKKKVVVVVNPLDGKFTAQSTLSLMRDEMKLSQEEIAKLSEDNHFMMTNANSLANQNQQGEEIADKQDGLNNGDYYQDGSVAVDVQGTKNNPTSVTVSVERVVAKMEDKTANYSIKVNRKEDIVHFEKVALINGNTKFFPIKKIREQGDRTNDYVVDPNFEQQTEKTINDFYSNKFEDAFNAQNGEGIVTKDLSTENRASFYTLENTMIAKEQKNAYTTGLYYQATYELSGKDKGTNIYQYGNTLYDFAELQEAAKQLGLNLKDLTDNSSQEEFYVIGVTKYEKGRCYYTYWIRHIDNQNNTEMGPMEFAVVRNNYYQMEINSVKGIGDYKPVDPNPETPDEFVDSYLDVKVKVLPWTIRNNKIDF